MPIPNQESARSEHRRTAAEDSLCKRASMAWVGPPKTIQLEKTQGEEDQKTE
jgi:hypothetical protein